jgi:hypothetical protein
LNRGLGAEKLCPAVVARIGSHSAIARDSALLDREILALVIGLGGGPVGA